MTFLKKLGQVLLNVAGIAIGLGPIVGPFLGSQFGKIADTVINDLTSIGGIVTQVEVIGQATGLTGTQKLQAALPLVSNIIKTSELVAGKKIADPAMFTKACQEFAQAAVDLLNSIHPDEVKTA